MPRLQAPLQALQQSSAWNSDINIMVEPEKQQSDEDAEEDPDQVSSPRGSDALSSLVWSPSSFIAVASIPSR